MSSSNSRLIDWVGYLAGFFLLLIPGSVVMVRLGSWQQGLLLYAAACVLGTLTLIVLIVLALLPRYREQRKRILHRAALVVPCALLLSAFTSGRDYPPIHDITTDTMDPPLFQKAAEERGEASNPLDIKPKFIAQQRAFYQDLTSLDTDLSPEAAYTRAVGIATQLGWKIYHQDPAGGVIEAVATTTIMGFKDDVVVRVRPVGSGSVVDLRSVSRVGLGDLGANAKRISKFIDGFQRAGR